MAALLDITVPNPQDQLDAYDTGALIYVNRGTTDSVGDSSQVTTIPIVATTVLYQYADPAGTPGTDRYWVRYGKASIVTADDASGWTGPILAGALAGGPLSMEVLKNWAAIDDTADDRWLPVAMEAINRAVISPAGIGLDLGPSPDTVRTFDGDSATNRGDRLRVPGGIRTFTTVEISTDGGVTWEDVTADVRLGPKAWERGSGEPYSYLEFKDANAISGPYTWFPPGRDNIRITGPAFGTFGWDAWAWDIVQDALAAFQRMQDDRRKLGDYPTETAAMRYLTQPLMKIYRDRYFPAW
jgi:hypothetical protein